LCGLPLYQYDHLLGWAKVQRHVADEITLLCDQHHREKTGGLLPDSAVLQANAAPFNRRSGAPRPYDLHFSGSACEIDVGGNSFGLNSLGADAVLVPISIDGTPILAFILQDGHLLLNLVFFDEYNQLVLHIKNNQLLFATSPWDIQLVGQNLVIREAARRILVDITFDVPNAIRIRRARMLRNGVELVVWPDRVVLANNGAEFAGNSMMNCPIGFAIGPHDPPISAMLALPHVPRYPDRSPTTNRLIDSNFTAGAPHNPALNPTGPRPAG
jgi:trigger factor